MAGIATNKEIYIALIMDNNIKSYISVAWRQIGKPILDYLLRKVSFGRILLEYFRTIAIVNGGIWAISSAFAYYKGQPLFQFSIGQIETPVMIIVNSGITIVMILVIILRIIEVKKEKVNSSNNANEYIEKRLSSFIKSHDDEIEQLLPIYKNSISDLRLQEAIKALTKLRIIVSRRASLDFQLISNIDFLIAQCLRYRSFKDAISKYELAYNEMMKSNHFFIDVASGYAYSLLKQGKNKESYEISKGILLREPLNYIANVCKLVNSNNLEESFKELDVSLKNNPFFLAYAYPYLIGKDGKDILDIEKISYEIPKTLTYDNLEIWTFNISMSVTKLLRHEGYYFFGGTDHHSLYVKDVFQVTDKYLELSKNTDINGIFSDIDIFHTYTKYFVRDTTKDEKEADIEFMKGITPSKDKRILYIQMFFEMLLFSNKEEEAVNVLERYIDLKNEVNYFLWIVLAYRYDNPDYANKGLSLLISNHLPVIEQHSVIAINSIITFSEKLDKEELKLLKFSDESVQKVYNACYNYYFEKQYKLQDLEALGNSCYAPVRFHIAEILADIGQVDSAITIVKPLASTKQYTSNTGVYIALLKKKGQWKKLLHLLKDLRHNGFTKIPDYLMTEFNLARQCNDINDVNEVIEVLYHKFPKDVNILFYYAASLNEQGKSEEFNRILPTLKQLKPLKDDNLVKSFTNLLFTAGKIQEGLEFLYQQMLFNKSQSLKDYLFVCSTSPSIGQYINNSKDIVEENDFVFYEEGGLINCDAVFKNSLIEDFIGKHVGDSIVINRFGAVSQATIKDIKNKYFAIIYNYTHSNEYKNSQDIQSFTTEDLKSYNGNIIDGLLALLDARGFKKAKDDFETKYSKGETSFLSEFNLNNGFEGCFNRMFGKDIIYTIPYQLYNNIDISLYNFVLDLSSLLLLSSLSLHFNLEFKKKFIIPEGLILYLKSYQTKEQLNLPSIIYNDAFSAYGLEKNKEQPESIIILKYLQNWINKYCIPRVAEDILYLNIKDSKSKNDPFFNLEVESMVLTINQPLAMLSEDWGLSKFMASNFKAINVESFLRKSGIGNNKAISEFLADIHFAGAEVDENYMLQQYNNYQSKQPNSFESCLEGLRINAFLVKQGINLAQLILNKKIKLLSDNFTATKILTNILESLSSEGRRLLIEEFNRQVPNNSELMHCFNEALKLSGKIIIN